jgi:hypothetical protein
MLAGNQFVVFDPHGNYLPDGTLGLRMNLRNLQKSKQIYNSFNEIVNLCTGENLDSGNFTGLPETM